MRGDNNKKRKPRADRPGANRFDDTCDEGEISRVREANENVRKTQSNDSTEMPRGRSGNRPRFDRDR